MIKRQSDRSAVEFTSFGINDFMNKARFTTVEHKRVGVTGLLFDFFHMCMNEPTVVQ